MLASFLKKEVDTKITSAFTPSSLIQATWVENISSFSEKFFQIISSEYYQVIFGSVLDNKFVESSLVKGYLTKTESDFILSCMKQQTCLKIMFKKK